MSVPDHQTRAIQSTTWNFPKARPFRTVPIEVIPHQRFAPARLLGTSKAGRSIQLHLWTDGRRIQFHVPRITRNVAIDPDQLVSVRIDADLSAVVDAWGTPASHPTPIAQPTTSVDRRTLLAAIQPPDSAAVRQARAFIPAAGRPGASASEMADACIADMRSVMASVPDKDIDETDRGILLDMMQGLAQLAHEPHRKVEGSHASRLSYRSPVACSVELVRERYAFFVAPSSLMNVVRACGLGDARVVWANPARAANRRPFAGLQRALTRRCKLPSVHRQVSSWKPSVCTWPLAQVALLRSSP